MLTPADRARTDYVRQLVERAPPLTAQQRDQLAALLVQPVPLLASRRAATAA